MATQREMNLLDNRIVARNIDKGLIAGKAYRKHLKDLPDVTDKSVPVSEIQPLEPRDDSGETKRGE